MRSSPRVLAAALVLSMACKDDVTGPPLYVAQQPFAITLGTSGVSRLQLTGINGNTTVTGVSQADSVFITGVREVGSRESQDDAATRLQDLEVQVNLPGGVIEVSTVQPANQEGRNYTVHYEVTLPKSFLVELLTANGDVRVSAVENSVSAGLANGTVTFDAIVGSVHASVANGRILCDATLPMSGTIELDTANGDIGLTIPANTSAQFQASSGNGDIRIFGLDLQDLERTSTRVTGRLGLGQGLIDLGTANGTITATGVAP